MEGMEKVRLLWSTGARGFLCLHRTPGQEVRVAMLRPSLEISRGYWYSLTSQKYNLSHHHVCSDGSGELWTSLWKTWVSPGDNDISEGKKGSQNNRHLSQWLWERISLPCTSSATSEEVLFLYLGSWWVTWNQTCHSSRKSNHGSQEAEGGSKRQVPQSVRMQCASKPESSNC